jgi:hypothetical protein
MPQAATAESKSADARASARPAEAPFGIQAPPVPVLLGNQALLRLQRKCDCGGAPDDECDSGEKRGSILSDRGRAATGGRNAAPGGQHPAMWGTPPSNQAQLRALALAVRRQDDPPQAASGPAAGAAQAAPQDTGSQAKPPLYGLLSLSINGPLTFAPWQLSDQLAIAVYSPKMSATGTVIADTSVNTSDYDVGFVQLLVASGATFSYTGSGPGAQQKMELSVQPVPIRDSETESEPWSKAADAKALNKGYIFTTEDRPNNLAPWQTPDGKGSLTKSEGQDYFCTWLAARHKPSGKFSFLSWTSWLVNWACSFDPAKQRGSAPDEPKGQDTAGAEQGTSPEGGGEKAEPDAGAGDAPASGGQPSQTSGGTATAKQNAGTVRLEGEGQGPFTPITGGPIANKSVKITWGAGP